MNVPYPDEKWYTIALRRGGLMIMAVIAPELVVMWAMRQLLVAREVEKMYKDGMFTFCDRSELARLYF